MSASLKAVRLLIWCLRVLVFLYDFFTFPIYFFYQQPWKQWKRKEASYGRRLNEKDPSSAVVRVDTHSTVSLDGVSTMDQVFRQAIRKFPEKKSFGTREVLYQQMETLDNGKPIKKVFLSDYRWLSYSEVDAKVEKLSKGLREIGVEPTNHVLIYAETRFEWFAMAQACFRINAVVVTLYTTLGDEEIVHGINDSDAVHVVTSVSLLPKLKSLISRIPKVKNLLYMEDVGFEPVEFPKDIRRISFEQLEKYGAKRDEDLSTMAPKATDIALIMYTSGSTGIPKGVQMSHKNLVSMVSAFGNIYRGNPEDEMYAAYLPLSHIFELSAECSFIYLGVTFGYASPFTLTDKSPSIIGAQETDEKTKEELMRRFKQHTCPGDLRLLKPTVLFVVPLMLDKMRKAIVESCRSKGPFAAMLFDFAIRYKIFWMKKGFQTPLLNRLIFRRIREQFGGGLRLLVCGGAPLSTNTHTFVKACFDAQILQGYGLTETSGASTAMSIDDPGTSTVGAPISGCYVKLVDWEEGSYRITDQPNPRGELVIGGEFVSVGYYKNPELTKESFREEDGRRWFYTGDIGELLANGNFKLIDRKKELVKLPFGEYIALGKIEAELKSCPLVENVCLYGNSYQMYLVALVIPEKNQMQQIAIRLKRTHLSHSELCEDPLIVAEVTRLLRQFSIQCRLRGAEIPKKVHLCSEEWTPDNGLLTAGMKLKRRVIENSYQRVIDRLYQD